MKSINQFDLSANEWDLDSVKVARAKAVSKAIIKNMRIRPGMHALEYGCGTGLLSFALQPELERITLADNSLGMLRVLQAKIADAGVANMRAIQLDLEKDPLPSERYDLVCSLMTFHHINDTSQLLNSMFCMLSSGGFLCVADLDAEDGSFHGEGFTGHHGFDRVEFERLVVQAGFANVSFTTVFQMSKAESKAQRDFPLFLMVAEKR